MPGKELSAWDRARMRFTQKTPSDIALPTERGEDPRLPKRKSSASLDSLRDIAGTAQKNADEFKRRSR